MKFKLIYLIQTMKSNTCTIQYNHTYCVILEHIWSWNIEQK